MPHPRLRRRVTPARQIERHCLEVYGNGDRKYPVASQHHDPELVSVTEYPKR